MARKYVWTVQIEIDAAEVEKHLQFGDYLALNNETAHDMVAEGLLRRSPGKSFRARSVSVERPGAPIFALQFGAPRLSIVK